MYMYTINNGNEQLPHITHTLINSCKYEFQVECLKEVDIEKITLTVADYDRELTS